MLKNFYSGDFSFSNAPKKIVAGELERINGRYNLSILYPFEEKGIGKHILKAIYYGEYTEGIINAKLIDKNSVYPGFLPISLLGLTRYDDGIKVKSYGFKYITFRSEYGKKEEVLINRIEFNFSGLYEFFGEEICSKECEVDIGHFEDFDLLFVNRLKFRWKRKYVISDEDEENKGKNEFNQFLVIKSEKGLKMMEFEEIIWRIKCFFSLVFSQEIAIKNITFGEKSNRVEAFANQGFLNKDFYKKIKIKKTYFLFYYSEIKDTFKVLITKWFKDFEKNKSSYERYYDVSFSHNMYLGDIFLNLIQSVEGLYDNSHIKKRRISQKEEKIIKEEIQKFSEKNKEKLGIDIFENISILTEKNLSEQILTIIDYLKINTEGFGEKETLTANINTMRNIFSHGGNKGNYSLEYIWNITRFLKYIIELFMIEKFQLKNSLYTRINENQYSYYKGELYPITKK